MEGDPERADSAVPAMAGGERTAVAFHEAGHAVVAIYLGLPVNRLSIRPNEATYGRMEHPSIVAIDLDERNLRREWRACRARPTWR